MSIPQVKVCGLVRRPDAELVAASGADFGGVILAPGGKRSVTAAHAATLFADLPLRRVGVFVDASAEAIRAAAATAGLHILQLHGRESAGLAASLRAEGGWEVWKAIRPRSAGEFLQALEEYAEAADGLLLDGWSPSAAGGTGARFPWEEVAEHRHRVPDGLRFIVAGGLAPGNVAEAIALLRPAVVDVSSGVETAPGEKDPQAVTAFVRAATTAAPASFSRVS